MKKGYGMFLNEWIEDERIKTSLRLLLKISSLMAKNGYCFASNKYFAEYFKTSEVTISKQIKQLESFGYLQIDYKFRGAQVVKREIRLKETLTVKENFNGTNKENFNRTVKENFKDNITSNNTISINNKNQTLKNAFSDTEPLETKQGKYLPAGDPYKLKDAFLELWNTARIKIGGFKNSNVNRLSPQDKQNLKEIAENYTILEIKNAIAGLLLQNENCLPHMKMHPKHFLEPTNFDIYLDAQINKKYNLYGDEKKQFKQQEL